MHRATQDWIKVSQTDRDLFKLPRSIRKPTVHTFSLAHICLYVSFPLENVLNPFVSSKYLVYFFISSIERHPKCVREHIHTQVHMHTHLTAGSV